MRILDVTYTAIKLNKANITL